MADTLQLRLQTGCKRYIQLGNCTTLLKDFHRRSLHQPNLHRSKSLPNVPLELPPSTPRIGKPVKGTTMPTEQAGLQHKEPNGSSLNHR